VQAIAVVKERENDPVRGRNTCDRHHHRQRSQNTQLLQDRVTSLFFPRTQFSSSKMNDYEVETIAGYDSATYVKGFRYTHRIQELDA
jgi:hypothetical protein